MLVAALTVAAGSALALGLGGLLYRKLAQHRAARALTIDAPLGIAEERFVEIGGIPQWIGLRGEDRRNPVLLVLHGGPTWPYAIFTPLLRSWEKHFTVVQWDRRGTGKTLGRNGKEGCGEMTFDRMVTDGLELAELLRRHLRHDKLVLLAGSMGTLVGIPMVKRRPDLFWAYVGTDLYVDMARNEALSWSMTLERLRSAGNGKGIVALEAIGPDPSRWDLAAWGVKMAWTMKTDPILPNAVVKLAGPLLLSSPAHSLRDIVDVFVGFEYGKARMFEQFMAWDARRLGPRFEVPFFLLQGATDVLTVTELAQEYFEQVEAPSKGLALIEGTGHFAAFARPDRFLAELLARVRPLAR